MPPGARRAAFFSPKGRAVVLLCCPVGTIVQYLSVMSVSEQKPKCITAIVESMVEMRIALTAQFSHRGDGIVTEREEIQAVLINLTTLNTKEQHYEIRY
jgi:hypothetical protein